MAEGADLGSMLTRRGVCLVIAAPSGAGKSSVTRALIGAEPRLVSSVSVTTRAKRRGEADGVDYWFRSEAEFTQLVADNALLEWARVFERSYGTPRAPVQAALEAGQDVVFDIDWQGYSQIKAALPGDTVGVFILPPSIAALADRLRARGRDPAEEIERRMQAARAEIEHWREFDHVVVNDELAACLMEVTAILHAARTATSRQKALAGFG